MDKETEESVREELKQRIMDMPVGDIQDFMVRKEDEEKEEWITYQDSQGVVKRYLVKVKPISYERYLQISMQAWKDSGYSREMYSLLIQVAQMKEIYKEIGGVKCDSLFWTRIRPDFADAIRLMTFGPSELDPKEEAEFLKNLMEQLVKYEQITTSGIQEAILKAQGDQDTSSTPTPTTQ